VKATREGRGSYLSSASKMRFSIDEELLTPGLSARRSATQAERQIKLNCQPFSSIA
jgi:hypothetical protein